MIKRLRKINDQLFRGSAPSPKDVINLYKYLGIRKIISLDQKSGELINKICKILGIKHIIIPLNGTNIKSLIQLFSYNLYDLLMKDGPTYIHCFEGKDRTGMVSAIFKCKYMGVSFKDALKEAISLGFGIGLPEKVKQLYIKLIYMSCNKNDSNNADILENSRDYDQNYMGSVIDEATMQSFAPFMDTSRKYPYDSIYNYQYEQHPTRDNLNYCPNYYRSKNKQQIPWVGLYDSNSGVKGVGIVDNGGGFTAT